MVVGSKNIGSSAASIALPAAIASASVGIVSAEGGRRATQTSGAPSQAPTKVLDFHTTSRHATTHRLLLLPLLQLLLLRLRELRCRLLHRWRLLLLLDLIPLRLIIRLLRHLLKARQARAAHAVLCEPRRLRRRLCLRPMTRHRRRSSRRWLRGLLLLLLALCRAAAILDGVRSRTL